ncbi:MAG: hypothetical protein NT096_12440 [Proteobacteria bacterium]|nr:hypothetical protein [Pseudomonadota bacterium]
MFYQEVTGQTRRNCYLILFVLFFISYAYFFQGGGWNQNVRICLVRAMIHHRSFKIDYYKEDAKEMESVNTGDWSFYRGHYYINKTPGLSFMAVPPFAITEYFLKYLFPHDEERQVHLSAYMSTLFTTTLFSALLCLLIFHMFHHFFQMGIINSFLLTLFFGFGTLAFSYSTTFYCHQPAAFCSLLSFALAMHIRHGDSQRKKAVAAFAGFSAASGVLIEPSTIYILAAIAMYLMSFKEGRRCITFFILGCVPPGIVQGFYSFMCFGNPLASSYNYSNDVVMWKVQGRLFGIPDRMRFYYLLFSPYRGLFFSSPVLLMAIPGIYFFFKDKRWRSEAILCAAISVFFILYIASFHAWHGGSAAGPRYLLPAYPYFFLLAGFSLMRFPKVFKVIGVISILINLSITLVGNEIPRDIVNPLRDVIFKNIITGNVSINPVPFTHFKNYGNLYDLANIEKWRSLQNFNSFNLGEILFPYTLASILPLICFWIIWGLGWRKFISTLTKECPDD